MDNREAIKKTIEKIAQLSKQPGNEWLHRELQSKWGSSNPNAERGESISNIEKYLAIDYDIDDMASQIDYSFVKEEVLRLKLEADWREMLRYRLGLRGHKIDYPEFCRYANLQAEGLIDYFFSYYSKTTSLQWINDMIDGYNAKVAADKSKTYKEGKPYQLERILYPDPNKALKECVSYTVKYCILYNSMVDNRMITDEKRISSTIVLSSIYKYRNYQSHSGVAGVKLPKNPPLYNDVESVIKELAVGIKQHLTT